MDRLGSTHCCLGSSILRCVIRCLRRRITPWAHPKLAVTMEVDVTKGIVSLFDVVLDCLDFRLISSSCTSISFTAWVRGCSGLTPVEVPIAVWVRSTRSGTSRRHHGLTLHAVTRPCVSVPVRVHDGGKVDVQIIHHIGDVIIRAIRLQSFGQHPVHCCCCDPFSCMKTTIHPESFLARRADINTLHPSNNVCVFLILTHRTI